MPDVVQESTQEFLASHLVWDNHGCMPMRPWDDSFLPQLERYRKAHVNVVSLNSVVGEESIEHHVRMAALFRRWLSTHSDEYLQVKSAGDIERAVREGKLGVFFDIEGMRA